MEKSLKQFVWLGIANGTRESWHFQEMLTKFPVEFLENIDWERSTTRLTPVQPSQVNIEIQAANVQQPFSHMNQSIQREKTNVNHNNSIRTIRGTIERKQRENRTTNLSQLFQCPSRRISSSSSYWSQNKWTVSISMLRWGYFDDVIFMAVHFRAHGSFRFKRIHSVAFNKRWRNTTQMENGGILDQLIKM